MSFCGRIGMFGEEIDSYDMLSFLSPSFFPFPSGWSCRPAADEEAACRLLDRSSMNADRHHGGDVITSWADVQLNSSVPAVRNVYPHRGLPTTVAYAAVE
jgi:hypothetical protein